MMRLEYNNEFAQILSDGSVKFYTKSAYDAPDVNKDLIEQTNEVNIKKYQIDSCQDFLYIIKRVSTYTVNNIFVNYLFDDSLVIIQRKLKSNNIILQYKFENEEIKKTITNLLGKTCSTLASNINRYNWVTSPEILDVLLTAANIRASGEVMFEKRTKLKKSGKVRVYYAPHENIKRALRNLNKILQRIYDKKNKDFQIAYKRGKSVYNNAVIHKNKPYVFNIDLKDFYPSCKKELVEKYIKFFFKYVPEKDSALEEFLNIITIDDGLFIGSPISGCLANAILSRPVAYIKNMCERNHMCFSAYADDMSFSSDRFLSEKFVKGMFTEAFASYGLDSYFSLNDEKSVGFSGSNRKITGVSLNNYDEVTVSRGYFRLLRTMIHHLSKGESVNIQKLQGKIAYAVMIDESGKVYKYLKKFEDTIKKYKLCSEEKFKELEEKFK